MGYYSRFSGEMTLSRELTHAEIKAIEASYNDNWFGLDTWEDEEDTDAGTLTYKCAGRIEVKYEDSGKAYTALEELQALIDLLPMDVTVSGEFRRMGEEAPDVSRYVISPIESRKVIEEKPRLVWPDGTEEPVRR